MTFTRGDAVELTSLVDGEALRGSFFSLADNPEWCWISCPCHPACKRIVRTSRLRPASMSYQVIPGVL